MLESVLFLLLSMQAPVVAGASTTPVDDDPGVTVRQVHDLLRDRRFQQADLVFARLVKEKPFTRDGDRLLEHLYRKLSEDESVAARIIEWRNQASPSRPALILSGGLHVHRGWKARGDTWAKYVEPSAMAQFESEMKLAQVDFEKAQALGAEDPNAAAGMLAVCRGLGRPRSTSDQWYAKALQADPAAWVPHLRMLYSLFPKWGGSWPEAEAFADQAARRSPSGSRIFALPFYFLVEQAQRSDDEAEFLRRPTTQAKIDEFTRRWRSELPRSSEAPLVLGKLRAEGNDHVAAVALFEECLKLDPDDGEARFQRGASLYRLKRYAEAESEFSRAVDLDPLSASPWDYRGRVAFYGRNDLTTALTFFEKAVALEPGNTLYLEHRGMTKVEKGSYQAGVLDLTAALARGEKRALQYFYRGIAYRALGRSEEAEHDFADAVRLDPNLASNVEKVRRGR